MNPKYIISMIPYALPQNWILYDGPAVMNALATAKAAILSLQTVPFRRSWVERLQRIELKREVAGTSRIEGAEFTERELDAAMKETPEQLVTRSQRQAHAAMQTYNWLGAIPHDAPINDELILHMHRLIITGADEDHCPPGKLRLNDENVYFGSPRHRGTPGGDECLAAFTDFTRAIQHEFQAHDPILRALAAHYHLAAMHPFLDGNGRTARALEALMLQRAGLRNTTFIAMSNYYYDEKVEYLRTLAETRQKGHDLTSFMLFSLKGVAIQGQRLLSEIQREISKELFRNLVHDLFGRLKTPRKRVIAERQQKILMILLDNELDLMKLVEQTASTYSPLKNPVKALIRDLNDLIVLGAVSARKEKDPGQWAVGVNLQWPTTITETEFFKKLRELPRAKTNAFVEV